MTDAVSPVVSSEEEFAALVDALAADNQRQRLTDLLRESHPLYDQRGAATVVQMRGWVLLALGRVGVSDDTLLFVLEELDTGVDPYLVAAAACALRTYPNPSPVLAPFVVRALTQIRYHDDPVSFHAYGGYDVSAPGTSPVRELLMTLAWLGRHASGVLPEIEAIAASGGLSKKARIEAGRALEAIGEPGRAEQLESANCCTLPGGLASWFSWPRDSRRGSESADSTVFEDQDGARITFKELVHGHPSIVVFFYTRCGNPLKCSLTVTKLARVQKLLEARGLGDRIHTAAITYDPGFDLPERMRRYGQNRGARLDANHRLLRAPGGMNALRRHFGLGVNFIESVVNRHRVEAYVLDAQGRIAMSFERLHWDEQEVVDCAIEEMTEGNSEAESIDPRPVDSPASDGPRLPYSAAPVWSTIASIAVACFPKCPMCWAAYLSVFGVTGLTRIPYSPWLQLALVAMLLVNIGSVWLRGWSTGRMGGPYLVSAGALVIILSRVAPGWDTTAVWGVALTVAGSLLSAADSARKSPIDS